MKRRVLSLLLAVLLVSSAVLPCLTMRANAVAGVDDLAVTAFFTAVTSSLGYKWQVTDQDAFADYIATTWDHLVELGGTGINSLSTALERWLGGKSIVVDADALSVLNGVCIDASSGFDGFTVDHSVAGDAYIGSIWGIPIYSVTSQYAAKTVANVLITDVMLNMAIFAYSYGSRTIFGQEYYFGNLAEHRGAAWVDSDYCYVLDPNNGYSGWERPVDSYFGIYVLGDGWGFSWGDGYSNIGAVSDSALLQSIVAGTAVPDSYAIDIPSGVLTGSDLAGEDADSEDDDLVWAPSLPKIGTNTEAGERTASDIITGVATGEIAVPGTLEKAADVAEPVEDTINMDPITTAAGGLVEVFPFCIPFDIMAAIQTFDVEPVAPHWEFHLFTDLGFDVPVNIDFQDYDQYAEPFRVLVLIFFIIGLGFATSKLIKW